MLDLEASLLALIMTHISLVTGRAVQPYQAAGEGGDELERSADDNDDSHLLSTLPILLTDFEHLASVITSQFSVYNTHSELLFGSLK